MELTILIIFILIIGSIMVVSVVGNLVILWTILTTLRDERRFRIKKRIKNQTEFNRKVPLYSYMWELKKTEKEDDI